MSKIVWHTTMSLDGFVADRHDSLDWLSAITDRSPVADEVMRTTGAVLTGRRMYDKVPKPHPRPYGDDWSGRVFILTHRPVEDPDYTFLTGDLADAVATALAGAGGKNLALFGPSVAGQCLQQGLVDEIVVHLVPIVLGDGVRFFDAPGGEPIQLELIERTESGQLTDLRFRPTSRRRAS